MEKERIKTKVAVLGAGPAGMAAAYSVASGGEPVTVLEKNDQVGGLARTVRQDGFSFDLGSHRFFTKKQGVARFVEGIMGDELITVPRTSRIYFRHKYFNYPPTMWNAFSGLGPIMSAKIMGSYLKERIIPSTGDDQTLEHWMKSQFGSVMYETFFKTYTEKVWGISCREIAAIWAAQRIKGMSLAAAVRQAVFPSQDPPASMIDRFRYPRGGIGRICEKMAEKLGSSVRLGAEVTGLARTDEGWRVEAGGKLEIEAREVVSTMPVTELLRIMEPRPPREVSEAAGRLGFRDLILVAAMFDRGLITRDSWIYIPDPEIIFGRFHEPANFSPEMSPPGKTSLVFDVFCFRTDPVWGLSDAELLERVIDDLIKIDIVRPGIRDTIIGHRVIRAPSAYPLHRAGYQEHLKKVKDYLQTQKGLWTVGREGLFEYLNIDHAIESGILAAENVGGAGHDIAGVIADSSYLESGN